MRPRNREASSKEAGPRRDAGARWSTATATRRPTSTSPVPRPHQKADQRPAIGKDDPTTSCTGRCSDAGKSRVQERGAARRPPLEGVHVRLPPMVAPSAGARGRSASRQSFRPWSPSTTARPAASPNYLDHREARQRFRRQIRRICSTKGPTCRRTTSPKRIESAASQ